MSKIKFLIVGSTLHSDNPGDLDLLAVLSKQDFKSVFHMTWEEMCRELRLPFSLIAESYKDKCKGATLILSQIFDKRHIDLKFVPEGMPYGDRKEIQLSELADIE